MVVQDSPNGVAVDAALAERGFSPTKMAAIQAQWDKQVRTVREQLFNIKNEHGTTRVTIALQAYEVAVVVSMLLQGHSCHPFTWLATTAADLCGLLIGGFPPSSMLAAALSELAYTFLDSHPEHKSHFEFARDTVARELERKCKDAHDQQDPGSYRSDQHDGLSES